MFSTFRVTMSASEIGKRMSLFEKLLSKKREIRGKENQEVISMTRTLEQRVKRVNKKSDKLSAKTVAAAQVVKEMSKQANEGGNEILLEGEGDLMLGTKDISAPKPELLISEDIDDLELLMMEGEDILEESETRAPSPSFISIYNFELITEDEIQTQIQALVDKRVLARKNVDYNTADAIKEQLSTQYGVEIQDRFGIWKGPNGRTGPIRANPDVNTPCQLSAEEVQDLISQRVNARRKRDYARADEIRSGIKCYCVNSSKLVFRNFSPIHYNSCLEHPCKFFVFYIELTEKGIEIIDRENIWRAFDRSMNGIQSDDFESSGRAAKYNRY